MVKGIIRKFDRLGRIVVPIEMRRAMNLLEGDEVDIYFKDGEIRLKGTLQCVCCGSTDKDKLVEHKKVLVCNTCAHELYGKVKY